MLTKSITKRERSERRLTRVVDTVDDCRVHLDEEHGWILDSDLHGLDERLEKSLGELHVALVNLALGHEAIIASQLPDTLRSSKKQVGRARLRHKKEHDNGHGGGSPDGLEE